MKKSGEEDWIEIVGADLNNLSDVDVSIPRRALTAIVGVSGSGKSSLVEGTLAVEGARRMRRFLDVELTGIEDNPQRAYVGMIPPMLFAGQRAFRASSRTTLATCTGILSLLRRLYVGYSHPYARDVGEPVPDASPVVFAHWLKSHVGGRGVVWAVPVRNQAVDGTAAARALGAIGIKSITVRSETDRGKAAETGKSVTLAKFKPLRTDVRHTIEASVAKIDLGRIPLPTLVDHLVRAWKPAPHGVFVELLDVERPDLRGAYAFGLDARTHRVHPASPEVYVEANPHLLTFNSPSHSQSGACSFCMGLGVAATIDESALVSHPTKSMHAGAFALWTPKNYRYVSIQHETIEGLRGRAGFDPDRPWKSLSPTARALILEGSAEPVEDRDLNTRKKASLPHPFVGFRRAILERASRPTPSGKALRTYVTQGMCPACGGSRWSAQARALRLGDWALDSLLDLTMAQLSDATRAKDGSLWRAVPRNAHAVVAQLHQISSSLVDVGLSHISSARGMLDVSDGESRRIPLASVLGSRLRDLLVVLDEPARGLHEEDLLGLGNSLRKATAIHTVVMSEHRKRLVAQADHLIELGPSAGSAGGRVTSSGSVQGTHWCSRDSMSLNAVTLSRPQTWLEIAGIAIHNVREESLRIPLGKLCCIAGVSGSGKSSVVRGVLVPAVADALPAKVVDIEDFRVRKGKWTSLRGAQHINSLHALDQTATTSHRRSLVMTYLGVAETLRKLFAAQPAAERLGLTASDFGTNSGRGRCRRCQGLGRLPDATDCPSCGGLRFGIDVLSVRISGMNIADVLGEPLSTLRSQEVAKDIAPKVLSSAMELGVGYLSLGRSLDTLSGGEVQRLRIARALTEPSVFGALFVLDEPAGGLHPKDVGQLLRALRHVVADGANTVVLVEHDPHLLGSCDHIIEFGPGSGPQGGKIVAAGSPKEIASKPTPTGRALAGRQPAKDSGTGKRVKRISTPPPPPTARSAARARAELRQIAGEDVIVPDDDDDIVRPSAIFLASDPTLRPHELGGLDLEIGSLLLDVWEAASLSARRHLLGTWKRHKTLALQICPFVDPIAVWGADIPRSIVKQTHAHLLDMGLDSRTLESKDAASTRASGPRLLPRDETELAHERALRDALALGGGFVELIDTRGRPKASLCTRPMELHAGLVAPRSPEPRHLARTHGQGRCPMCSGTGLVPTIDTRLVVAKASNNVLDPSSLVPSAASILKGIWRSEFRPFFQRLAAEGMWDECLTWGGLCDRHRAIVLHGYWVRPGHGTFLKVGPKYDGSEVKHWLRWDGLITAVLTQLDRSRDKTWAAKVRASKMEVPCPTCDGTGLGPTARLLRVGGRSLYDWTRSGTVKGFVTAFQKVGSGSLPERSKRKHTRILDALGPIRSSKVSLIQPADSLTREQVLAKCSMLFTGMKLTPEP